MGNGDGRKEKGDRRLENGGREKEKGKREKGISDQILQIYWMELIIDYRIDY